MINRRNFTVLSAGMGLGLAMPRLAMAAPTSLTWSDLIPGGGPAATADDLQPHEENGEFVVPANDRPAPTRPELEGQEITIRGYLVPIGYKQGSEGQVIAGFLLAPFVGACVHVPPPPANQIVLGNYPEGLPMSSRIWFDPVYVTGIMRVTPLETSLARIGYQIEASNVTF
jgi:hypothetical protein